MCSGGLSFPRDDPIVVAQAEEGEEKARKLHSAVDLVFRHRRFGFAGEGHRIMVIKSIIASVFLSWVGNR